MKTLIAIWILLIAVAVIINYCIHKTNYRKFGSVALLLLLLAGCGQDEMYEPKQVPVGTFHEMLNYVNPGYQFDSVLFRSAEMQVEYMVEHGTIAHEWADGTGPDKRAFLAGFVGSVGECTARGQRTEAEVLQAWVDSPAHMRVIMTPAANRYGFFGRNGYWCLVVGRRSGF